MNPTITSEPSGLGRRAGAAALAACRALAPLADLALRLYVARIFFAAGLVKLGSWSTTLLLFESEYQVPWLAPEAAALLATGAELVLPVLLALGLGARAAAFGLFVFNAVAVLSYPGLGEVGLHDHLSWGLLLLVTLLHGPGRWSLDGWITRGRR